MTRASRAATYPSESSGIRLGPDPTGHADGFRGNMPNADDQDPAWVAKNPPY